MGSSRLQQAADILGTVPFFFEGATGGTYNPAALAGIDEFHASIFECAATSKCTATCLVPASFEITCRLKRSLSRFRQIALGPI